MVTAQTSESLVVKRPEGVQITNAAWMLAPLACRQLHDAPPVSETGALRPNCANSFR
jgi:hypothetical protein